MALKRYDSNSAEWQTVVAGSRGPKGLSSSLMAPTAIKDNLQEWWIYPVATYVPAENRTLFGGYATTGKVLVNEVNHETGETKRVEIADSYRIDDHNNPSVHVEAGRRILVGWTNHNYDDQVRFKVSDSSGNIDSLATASEQNFTAAFNVTYTQIHKIPHLSDETTDYFWVFYRGNNMRWNLLRLSVDQATGVITFGTTTQLTLSPGQAYLSTAPSHKNDNRIRVSWYHNPASDYHGLWYLEIDTVTGSIYSPMDDTSPIANISGTNLPIELASVTPVLPEPPANISRRMFYVRPGPIRPAIAYAEWDKSTPDEATYKIIEATNDTLNTWAISDYGIAGVRVGYGENANYIAGMAFPDPCDRNMVMLCRNINGRGVAEWHTKTNSVRTEERVYETTQWVGRPMVVRNGGPATAMFSDVARYASFADYDSKVVLTNVRPPSVSYPTTNDIKNGWGWAVENGGKSVEIPIVFDTPFDSTPIVVASFAGGHNAGTATELHQFKSPARLTTLDVLSISNTGFTIEVKRTADTNFPSNGVRRFAFTWMAMPMQ